MATPSSTSYYTRLLIFSLFTALVVLAWGHYAPERFQTNLKWVVFVFFIAITSIIHIVLTKTSDQNPKKFIMRYMAISGLRLFGFLIIITIYALIKRSEALGFTLLFLLMYLLFSAFEAISLLKYLKK